MFTIATWNVNSLNVRLPQVLEWLQAHPHVTVLALQETKLTDEKFPQQLFTEQGYHIEFCGQPTYNGVAIISKLPCLAMLNALPNLENAAEKRFLAVTVGNTRIVNVYVPNGAALDSPKYPWKLSWLTHLNQWLQTELKTYDRLALLGDFNIAPMPIDIYNADAWGEQILFSPAERAQFQALLALGLYDTLRLHHNTEGLFTWWDYRQGAFRRNMGLRIDHILISEQLKACSTECEIDITPRRNERPSDHAPVIATFEGEI